MEAASSFSQMMKSRILIKKRKSAAIILKSQWQNSSKRMLPAEAIKPAIAAYGYAFPQSVIIKHFPPHDLECQLYTFANTNSVRYQVSYSWYSSLDSFVSVWYKPG